MTLLSTMTWSRSTTWEEMKEKPFWVLTACLRSVTARLTAASFSALMEDLGIGTILQRSASPELSARKLYGGMRLAEVLERGFNETQRKERLIQAQQNLHLLHTSCTVKRATNPSFENDYGAKFFTV